MSTVEALPPLRGNPKRRQAARTPKLLTLERYNLLENQHAMGIYLPLR